MSKATEVSTILLLLSIMAPNALGVMLFLPLTAILGGIVLWRRARGIE